MDPKIEILEDVPDETVVTSVEMSLFFKRGVYNITVTNKSELSVELVEEQEFGGVAAFGLAIRHLRDLGRAYISPVSAQEIEDAMDTLQKLANAAETNKGINPNG